MSPGQHMSARSAWAVSKSSSISEIEDQLVAFVSLDSLFHIRLIYCKREKRGQL